MRLNTINNLLRGIILFSVLLLGCKNSMKEVIIETHSNGSAKTIKYIEENDNESLLKKEIQYYENGKKRYEGHFNNNKKDGEWIFWFENGNIWSEGYFKAGIRSGKSKVFHENGSLYYDGAYSEGKKQGIWHFYNPEGIEVNWVKYEKGSIIEQKKKSDDSKE
ncbi:MAG: hypothetical protein JEZ09_12250 [Salinivirgaceae bacterium]|nr:hypothetical protein [Salinivirgaceae bacterium]